VSQILSKLVEFLPNLISFIAGFVIAIFAEPVRRFFFKPNLNLEFDENKGCVSGTFEVNKEGEKIADARYIRVKVTNTTKIIAKNCRAYLINIEKWDGKDNFMPTGYYDSIQLAWSCQGWMDRWRGLHICKGVNQYVDVLVTRNTSEAFDPQIMCKPFRYLKLFKEKGKFLFTTQVSADRADPKIIKLEFDWNGTWDGFVVKRRK